MRDRREHFHLLDGFSFPIDKERIKKYINGILLVLLIIIVVFLLDYIAPKIWHWVQALYNTLCDDIYHIYRRPLY
jgi:hypothetical protein